jgi:hypothetical protein
MADYVPFVVCRFWLIPDRMNVMVSGLFFYRAVLPTANSSATLYTDCAGFIHLRSSAVSAGVICQKNPVRDVTEIKKCIGMASLTVIMESR